MPLPVDPAEVSINDLEDMVVHPRAKFSQAIGSYPELALTVNFENVPEALAISLRAPNNSQERTGDAAPYARENRNGGSGNGM